MQPSPLSRDHFSNVQPMIPVESAIEIAGEPQLPPLPLSVELSSSYPIDWKAAGWKALSLLAGGAVGVGLVFVLAGNPNGWIILAAGATALTANLVRAGYKGAGRKEVLEHLVWALGGAILGAGITAMVVVSVPAMAAAEASHVGASDAAVTYLILGAYSGIGAIGLAIAIPFTSYSTNRIEELEMKDRLNRKIFENLNLLFADPQRLKKPTDWPSDSRLNEICAALEPSNLTEASKKGLSLVQILSLRSHELEAFYTGACRAYDAQHYEEAHDMLELLTHYHQKNSAFAEACALAQEKLAGKKVDQDRAQGYVEAASLHEKAAKLLEDEPGGKHYRKQDPLPLYMQCAKCYLKAGNNDRAATVLREAISRLQDNEEVHSLATAQRMLKSITSQSE